MHGGDRIQCRRSLPAHMGIIEVFVSKEEDSGGWAKGESKERRKKEKRFHQKSPGHGHLGNSEGETR